MDYRSALLRLCVITATSFSLMACSGGKNDSPSTPSAIDDTPTPEPEPTPEPIPPVSSAKHFVYVNKESGELFAVTDDNLNAPISIATGITAYQLITTWDYDLEAKTFDNFDNKLALYAKDGRLYKALLGGEYESFRVSNESHYCPESNDSFIFGSISVGGFDESGATWSGYTSAGPDEECGTADDTYPLIQLSMDSETPPVIPPGIELSDIFDEDTGLLAGWLLLNSSGKLIRTNENFQFPQAIAGAPASQQWIHHAKNESLNIFEDKASNTLYIYDEPDGSFTTAVSDFHASESLIDGTAFYWLDPIDKAIKKINFDGTATTLATSASKLTLLTENFLVYQNHTNDHYYSVLKTGGTPSNIFVPQTLGTLIPAPNDLLYINNFTIDPESNSSSVNASIIQAENGVINREYPHAQWLGGTISNHLSLNDENRFTLEHIVLAQRSASTPPWTNYKGGTLINVDASTMNELGELGTIPENKRLDSIFGLSSSTLTTDKSAPTDIFYLDTTSTGSLVKITTASDGSSFQTNTP